MVKHFPTRILLMAAAFLGLGLLHARASSGAASNARGFAVSQAVVAWPVCEVYASGMGNGPVPLTSVSATLGSLHLAPLSVQPFSATGESVFYIVAVDVSRSLHEDQFRELQSSLLPVIQNLGPGDRMALISFGSQVQTVVDATGDKKALSTGIDSLHPVAEQTHLNQALLAAFRLAGREDPDLPARRVILVMSDGKDEGSGVSADDVLRQAAEVHIPIYAIGVSRLPEPDRAKYLDILRRFAILSGGDYLSAAPEGAGSNAAAGGASKPSVAYQDLAQDSRNLSVLKFQIPPAAADAPTIFDGSLHRLQVTYSRGGEVFTDGAQIRLLPLASGATTPRASPANPGSDARSSTAPRFNRRWLLLLGVGGLIVLAGVLLAAWIVMRRRRNTSALPVMASNAPAGETAGVPAAPNIESPSPAITFVPPASQADHAAPSKAAPPGLRPDAETAAPSSPAEEIALVVVRGNVPGKTVQVRLSRPIVIGRGGSCDVILEADEHVSRQHCELFLAGDTLMIRDSGSTTGTRVNGLPVRGEQRLEDGDLIGAGSTELRVLRGFS